MTPLARRNAQTASVAKRPSRREQAGPSKPSSQRQPPSRAQWPWALQWVSSTQVRLQRSPKKPMTQSQPLALGERRGERGPVAESVAAAGDGVVADRAAGGADEAHRAIALT